jgi:voltage-gated sodium channel
MTLESWSMGIVRPVMEVFPYAWAFFVPFIIVSSFTVLNLFIAIIVDSMQTLHRAEEEETRDTVTRVVHAEAGEVEGEIAALRREIRALHKLVEEKLR